MKIYVKRTNGVTEIPLTDTGASQNGELKIKNSKIFNSKGKATQETPTAHNVDLTTTAQIGQVGTTGAFTTPGSRKHVKVDIGITDLYFSCGGILEDGLILNIYPDPTDAYRASLWCLDSSGNSYAYPSKYNSGTYNIKARFTVPMKQFVTAFICIWKADGTIITDASEAVSAISVTVENLRVTGDMEFNDKRKSYFLVGSYINQSLAYKSTEQYVIPVSESDTVIVDDMKMGCTLNLYDRNFILTSTLTYSRTSLADENSIVTIKGGQSRDVSNDFGHTRYFMVPSGCRYIGIDTASIDADCELYLNYRPNDIDISYDERCVEKLKILYPQLKNFKGQYCRDYDTCALIRQEGANEYPPNINNANYSYRPYLDGNEGDFWVYYDPVAKKFKNTIARWGDIVWFDGTALLAMRNPYAHGINMPSTTEYDVIIVGGGAGGVGAAYALRDSGLKVCLVEKQNYLGGTHTVGGLLSQIASPIGDWYKSVALDGYDCAALRFNDRGTVKSIASGDETETDFDKYWRASQHNQSRSNIGNISTVNAWYLSKKYHDDITDGGIDILYNREFLSCTEQAGNITEVTFANIVSGETELLRAAFFIDSTGDAYLARFNKTLNKDYFIGSDPHERYNESAVGTLPDNPQYDINTLEQIYMYSSYNSSFRNTSDGDIFTSDSPYAENADELPIVDGVTIGQNSTGYVPEYREVLNKPHGINTSWHPGYAIFVSPDYYCGLTQQEFVENGYNATKATADERAKAHYKLNRKTDNTYFIEAAPMLAIREGYRMRCEYMVTQADIEKTVTSDNYVADHIIALSSWYADIHKNSGSLISDNITNTYLNGIPYEAMIPCTQKNVLVACRAYGASHIGLSAIRLTRTMLSLGYAAGKAALQAATKDLIDFRDVDVETLQKDVGIAELLEDLETNILPSYTTTE